MMSVNPGFGGQAFIPGAVSKLEEAAGEIDRLGTNTILSVDGGINDNTMSKAVKAGARLLVMGS